LITITCDKSVKNDFFNPNLKIIRLNSFRIKTKCIIPNLIPRLINLDTDIFNVFLIGSYAAWTGNFVGKIKGIPTVLTMDWNLHDLLSRGIKIFYDVFIKLLTLKTSDIIVVYTDDQKEKLTTYGISREKIKVIPYGVNYKKYNSIKKTKNAKIKLGLIPENKIILTVSRLSPEKNLELLIKAFSRVKKQHKNISLLIIGPKVTLTGKSTENYHMKLKSLVRHLNLSNDVIFYGFIKDIRKAYAVADIFAFSSKSESFACVLVQAAASGTPIISTPVGIAPDLAKKKCAITANDFESYVKGLELLVRDDSFRKRMGENAKKVAKEYSWPKIISKYNKLYEKVLSK